MATRNVTSLSLHEVNTYLRSTANGAPLKVNHADHLHGLAAGMKHGEIIVTGNGGDYLGVLNAGATIRVTGNAGNYLADNMTNGTVIVEGNAGFGAAQYCYGGTVVIHGNAGDFAGTMNKGAVILINGDVGDDVGTYMLKGDLIVVGNAGDHFANYLIRGSIFLGGECRSLGHNTKLAALNEDDLTRLQGYFEKYGIQADPAKFKKIIAASEKPFYH